MKMLEKRDKKEIILKKREITLTGVKKKNKNNPRVCLKRIEWHVQGVEH